MWFLAKRKLSLELLFEMLKDELAHFASSGILMHRKT
jgi:hypothetical protein